ncbi:9590_t:CDS:2, partial [Gigaspora rosea]
ALFRREHRWPTCLSQAKLTDLWDENHMLVQSTNQCGSTGDLCACLCLSQTGGDYGVKIICLFNPQNQCRSVGSTDDLRACLCLVLTVRNIYMFVQPIKVNVATPVSTRLLMFKSTSH